MAAAYAAVVSVMHLMDQINAYHLRSPVFVDTQLRQLESLRLKVSFLLDFLETQSDGDARNDSLVESFESRIVDACYALEDVIETYIVDHIHGRFSTLLSKRRKKQQSKKKPIVLSRSTRFSQNLQKITEYIDSIKRDILVEIRDQSRVVKEPQLQERDRISALRLFNTGMDTLVGLDDISNQIMDELTGQQRNLQVIPITGMGGSGKSTLAKKVYDSKYITERFDVRRWVTVSQQFNVKELLLGLLSETQSSSEEHSLGERLHKMLFGRRYVIVIDDIWSTEAWNRIRLFLPDNANGSRIIITTRLMDLASHIGSCNPYTMDLLDEYESWILLQKKVFLKGSCPPDLENIGRKIATDCRGLPLSIVVIGGLLAKSVNVEYWESVAEDVSKTVNSAEDELCLKILDLSYRHLPIHLKPCFLYFGMFQEDVHIRASEIVRLWVAEGLVKPKEGKSLEEVAIIYWENLINRNLIFATGFGSTGTVRYCKIHDLLRDFCLREGEKQRFLYASKVGYQRDVSQGFNESRRISLQVKGTSNSDFEPSPILRSLICDSSLDSLVSSDVKLLRVFVLDGIGINVNRLDLINSRYLDLTRTQYLIPSYLWVTRSDLPKTVHLFWNLQTIRMHPDYTVMLSCKIWEMPELRHVRICSFSVDDSYDGKGSRQEDNIVLENLQTLSTVVNFRFSKEFLMRIPNVKKLKVKYTDNVLASEYIENLSRMAKLESLSCYFDGMVPRVNISELKFSQSLKKLRLCYCDITWDNIGEQIGLLPHLEKFAVHGVKSGEEWNSVDGQFCRLKYLYIGNSDLVSWTADSSSFPRLERLVLGGMELLEIPCEIGEIPAFQSIVLYQSYLYTFHSTLASAMRIQVEQMSYGNENIGIRVHNITTAEELWK